MPFPSYTITSISIIVYTTGTFITESFRFKSLIKGQLLYIPEQKHIKVDLADFLNIWPIFKWPCKKQ